MIDRYDELVAQQQRQAVFQWLGVLLAWMWPGLAIAVGLFLALVVA